MAKKGQVEVSASVECERWETAIMGGLPAIAKGAEKGAADRPQHTVGLLADSATEVRCMREHALHEVGAVSDAVRGLVLALVTLCAKTFAREYPRYQADPKKYDGRFSVPRSALMAMVQSARKAGAMGLDWYDCPGGRPEGGWPVDQVLKALKKSGLLAERLSGQYTPGGDLPGYERKRNPTNRREQAVARAAAAMVA
jgi:hypothetical protein